MRNQCWRLITCVLLLGLLPTRVARATDVDADVSVRETLVGLPVTLTIRITNSVEHDPPEFPRVDGLEIEQAGVPSRSTRVSIINGRRTETNDIIYTFRVTPQREGRFTIPPIRVTADGARRLTKAVRIIATKGDTEDLLFVEIEGSEEEIYVGEPLELQLKIWIRPFRDPQVQQRLSEGEMWNQLSPRSNWGSFQSALEEMASNRQRPGGRARLREDSQGNEREYYLYTIRTKIYPDRPGQLEGSDVRILMQYPQELARSRSPFALLDDDEFFGGNSPFGNSLFDDAMFGGGLRVAKWKPLVAEAIVEPITIKPVPITGRPDDYRGAVGQFSIVTEASPTDVRVGDPITLHIGIDGKGQLDVVRAPPIESQQNLVSQFKVPDEPLAGFVDGQQKIFTTTIRPTQEGVTEIPGIRFSYFDPDQERFVTTTSDPISINVDKADVLSLDSIVGGASAGRQSQSRSDASADAGKKSDEETLADSVFGLAVSDGTADGMLAPVPRASLLSTGMVTALCVGPLAACFVLLVRSRTSFGRFVPARRRLRRELEKARTPVEIADAFERFVSAHYRLPDSRLRRDQTIGAMRASGNPDLAIHAERFYASCHQSPLRDEAAWLGSLREQASELADEVASSRVGQPRASFAAGRVALVLCCLSAGYESAFADELELTTEQQRALLREALPIDSSLSGVELEQALKNSQVKLQTLVDSGIQNDELFFALGRVAQQSGEVGTAVANYRRALRLRPENDVYRRQLFLAESDVEVADVSASSLDALSTAEWFRLIPVRSMRVAFFAAWFCLWSVVIARLLGKRFRWNTLAAIFLFVTFLSGGGYLLGVQEFVRDGNAVLIAGDVTMRSGDGEEFESVMQLTSAEGQLVRCTADRGNWLQIELQNGTRGWIHRDMAISI